MAGKGSASRPRNPPADTKQNFVLDKGKTVEVSSDDEGFRGAWYLATIVDSPPKSASKKRKKAMVEYKTLVKEDGTPLIESVDPALIRPLPPDEATGDFRVGDIVDADYRDGWWTGVVRKVLGGSRYRVYFDNPPDVMDFDGKDLRSHWAWVDGEWVASEKQQTTGSVFSSGAEVEVNCESENARDVWFPAVVIKENEDGTLLVKYQNYGNDDEAGKKVSVDSSHIRPFPPRYVDRDYELLEKVDAPYSSGWRPGVITKLLPGRRYNVFFKHGNEDRELNHSEIRPHAEWVDGHWNCKSKEILVASDAETQFDSAHDNAGELELSLKLETNGAANGKTEQKTPSSTLTTVNNLLEQSTQRNKKSVSFVLPPNKKAKLEAPTRTGSRSRNSKNSSESVLDVRATVSPPEAMNMPIESPAETLRGMPIPKTYGKRSRRSSIASNLAKAQTKSPLREKRTVAPQVDKHLIRIKELPEKRMQLKLHGPHRQKLDFETTRGQSTSAPPGSLQVAAKDAREDKKEDATSVIIGLEARANEHPGGEKLKVRRTPKKSLNDLAGGNIVGLKQQTIGGNSQRRKRGRPFNHLVGKASGIIGNDDSNQKAADESIAGEKAINQVDLPIQDTVSQVVLRETEKDCTTNRAVTANPEAEDEDQPLSAWIGADLRSSPSKAEKRKRDVNRETTPHLKEASSVDDRNQCLPFVKRSLVWQTIESMEVFKLVPQKPHFQPLADSKEEYREGSAIGVMVTFASMFDKVKSLKFDDPKTEFESSLESLADLERHGFDVTIARNRVNQLLSIKDGTSKLQIKSKDAETQIKEHCEERTKLEANVKEIENKIAELQKELAATKLKMENKDHEIAGLKTRLDSVNLGLNNACVEFEKLASAPWKLP